MTDDLWTAEEFLIDLDRRLYGGGGQVADLEISAVPCACGDFCCHGWAIGGGPESVRLSPKGGVESAWED